MNGNFLDWTVPSSNFSSSTDPNTLEGSGVVLEVTRYDSLYNAEGERLILPAGQSYQSNKKRSAGYEKAIVVTKVWNSSNKVDYTRLEIRSPHMKAALKKAIPAYRNIEIGIDHIWIRDKPHCLFHYRNELQSYGMNVEGTNLEAARHVHFLLSYMWDQFIPESISFFSTIGVVTSMPPSLEFDYLWMGFRPGDLVYVPKEKGTGRDHDTAFIFAEMKLDTRDKWSVTGYRIGYAHRQFGYVEQRYSIRNYHGVRALQNLEIIPAQYVSDILSIRDRLVSRGRLFTTLHSQHYHWFEGQSNMLVTAGRFEDEEDGDYRYRIAKAAYRPKLVWELDPIGRSVGSLMLDRQKVE